MDRSLLLDGKQSRSNMALDRCSAFNEPRGTLIRGNEIFLHALKNGAAIWLPLYPDVKFALEAVLPVIGAPNASPYVFWTGLGDRDGHIKTVVRTLKAVFDKSGVVGASSHRFRHTLATDVLVNGGSIEDAANLLGDSPDIIRKHYAKGRRRTSGERWNCSGEYTESLWILTRHWHMEKLRPKVVRMQWMA